MYASQFCAKKEATCRLQRSNFLQAQAVVCSAASSAGFGASCRFGLARHREAAVLKTHTDKFCLFDDKNIQEWITMFRQVIFIVPHGWSESCSKEYVCFYKLMANGHGQFYHYFVKTQDIQVN